MINLEHVSKAIKNRYDKPILFRFIGIRIFREGGYVSYSVFADCMIKKVVIKNRRVNVIVHIRKFNCWPLFWDYALADLHSRIKMQIIKVVPESEGIIDLSIQPKVIR